MKFELSFEMDNDAFKLDSGQTDNPDINTVEVARILTRVIVQLEEGYHDHGIKDIDGNTVGKWFFQPNADEEI